MNSKILEKKIVVAALDALSQEIRLDIFRLLVTAGKMGMPAGVIGETLGVPNATLSFHLQQLKHAGLATSLRKGTTIRYHANYGSMYGLIAYLTENCCQGSSSPECDIEPACCELASVQETVASAETNADKL